MVVIIATIPPRITITADDVRELLRLLGWGQQQVLDGWERWTFLSDRGDWLAWIPIMPDPRINLTQARLWNAVRDAGLTMGIGTDIYVHLGMMLQRRLQTPPEEAQ